MSLVFDPSHSVPTELSLLLSSQAHRAYQPAYEPALLSPSWPCRNPSLSPPNGLKIAAEWVTEEHFAFNKLMIKPSKAQRAPRKKTAESTRNIQSVLLILNSEAVLHTLEPQRLFIDHRTDYLLEDYEMSLPLESYAAAVLSNQDPKCQGWFF